MSQKISTKKQGGDEHEHEPGAVSEAAFARQLGIALDVLVDARNSNLDPADFREKSGRIYYEPAGVLKLREVLGLPQSAEPKPPTPSADPGAPRPFWIQRRVTMNTRLLVVTPDQEGAAEPLRVRVRNNRLYAVGSQILALPPSEGAAHWRAIGRAPRRRT